MRQGNSFQLLLPLNGKESPGFLTKIVTIIFGWVVVKCYLECSVNMISNKCAGIICLPLDVERRQSFIQGLYNSLWNPSFKTFSSLSISFCYALGWAIMLVLFSLLWLTSFCNFSFPFLISETSSRNRGFVEQDTPPVVRAWVKSYSSTFNPSFRASCSSFTSVWLCRAEMYFW